MTARMRGWSTLLAAALGLAVAARSGAAQAPAADPRLAEKLTAEVRAASIDDVLQRLSAALEVPMEAEGDARDTRITLSARDATLGGLQRAIAALLKGEWVRTDAAGGPRYVLRGSAELRARARALQSERKARFLTRLLETERNLGRRGAESVARAIREDLARRQPHLPAETLADITPGFIRQVLLLSPIRLGLGSTLLRGDSVWAPFHRLPAPQQQLLAGFLVEQYRNGSAAVTQAADRGASGPNPWVLNYPQARLEYRFLYGDRWTGTLLMTRVGASDNWAEALLPSTLFDLPDYASLYPESLPRPVDAELYRALDPGVQVDTGALSWDQALASISRSAGINVLSDSYLRPGVFSPVERGPVIRGTNLLQLLDRTARHYGYVWWKEGDWFVFRHRLWAEEERVAVPDRITRALAASIAADQRLSDEDLGRLASLSDEQLLSMHLYGRAAGSPTAPPESFDYQEVNLAHSGLLLLAQMDPSQRELARSRGLPFLLMNAVQQYVFASLAYDRGISPDPLRQAAWRFRATDRFRRERLPAGWAEVGRVQFEFEFGPATTRRTELAIRVPAVQRPKSMEDAR